MDFNIWINELTSKLYNFITKVFHSILSFHFTTSCIFCLLSVILFRLQFSTTFHRLFSIPFLSIFVLLPYHLHSFLPSLFFLTMLFLITCAARLMVNFFLDNKVAKIFILFHIHINIPILLLLILRFSRKEEACGLWFYLFAFVLPSLFTSSYPCLFSSVHISFVLHLMPFSSSHFDTFHPLSILSLFFSFLRFENTFFLYQSLPKPHQFRP